MGIYLKTSDGFICPQGGIQRLSLSVSPQQRTVFAMMAGRKPPWQRRGPEKKQDPRDDLWVLEQSLLNESSPRTSAFVPSITPTSKTSSSTPEKTDHTLKDTDGNFGTLRDEANITAQFIFVANTSESLIRVDRFLTQRLKGHSRSSVCDLLDRGFVYVNGSPARKSLKIVEGDEIFVLQCATNERLAEVEEEDIPLDVLYEDEHVIAVNKAPGMVVHPAPGNRNGTFVNALLAHVARRGGEIEEVVGSEGRPGVVHRLDKGTSGVLLAAKTARAHAALSSAFAERRVNKTYLAISIGNPSSQGAVIDVPIGRHPRDRQRMAVAMQARTSHTSSFPGASNAQDAVLNYDGYSEDYQEIGYNSTEGEELLMGRGGNSGNTPLTGRKARSTVKTLAFDGRLSVVEVGIETGRTHQIRVHLQHRRNPVLGDELYGNAQWNARARRRWGVTRPMLHALRLVVDHPVTGDPLRLVAPVPPDMLSVAHGIWPQVKGRENEEWWDMVDRGPSAGDEGMTDRKDLIESQLGWEEVIHDPKAGERVVDEFGWEVD